MIQGGRIMGNLETRFLLNLGTQAKFWSTPKFPMADKERGSQPNLAQVQNFVWLTKRGILNQNLAQLQNFLWLTKRRILNQN